jgi:hypothetical protein
VRLRVTARFGGYVVAVAHGVLWSYCCRRGYKPMGFSRIDARTLRPRPPLVVTDALGRRQPVGRLAVGTDAVWTQTPEDERLWRVPLGGWPGPRRAGARHRVRVGRGRRRAKRTARRGRSTPPRGHDQR